MATARLALALMLFAAAPTGAARAAGDSPPIGATIAGRADEAAMISSVILAIADNPGAVSRIIAAAVAAAPSSRNAIVRQTTGAFPSFAGPIALAAGYVPPPLPAVPPPYEAAQYVTQAAPQPTVVAATAAQEPAAFGSPFLAAARLGVLEQDIDFIGTSFESGQAINPELQFKSPALLAVIGAPRPTIGATFSTAGGTNTLYGGLNWHFEPFAPGALPAPLFFDGFFGFSLHDGNATDTNTADEKTLGCDVLFRGALEAGVRFARNYTLSLMVSHLSHGEILCPNSRNRGMDHFGVRLGYEY